MENRFPPGSTAYTKDGRAYTVEEVDGGIVYCSLPNGTETDFSESTLFNEEEWATKSSAQEDVIYGRIKRAAPYSAQIAEVNLQAAETFLLRANNLVPGLLDVVAYFVAANSLSDSGNSSYSLSIKKCRAVFDAHTPDVRLSALAHTLQTEVQILVDVSSHGDNLIRALIEKGISTHDTAFDEFCDRPRN